MSKAGHNGSGKGNRGGPGATQPSQKAIQDILKLHQVKNSTKFLESLANIGIRIPKPPKGKGKGKGKDAPKRPKNPPKQPNTSSNLPGKGNPQSKVRDQARAATRPVDGQSGQGQSFYGGSSGIKRPIITVAGTKDTIAVMLDHEGKQQQIQFICHAPTCHLAHYRQRKQCLACGAGRDAGLEPTVYDPAIHKTFIAQKCAPPPLLATPKPKPSPPSGPGGHAANAAEGFDDFDIASADAEMEDEAVTGETEPAESPEVETDKALLADWVPSCLTKASVKLCIHEGSQEVLKYKHLFDVQDLAESEITAQIETARKRLSIMELDPASFVLDIALTKQRITLLEEKRAKEDVSTHTSGELHTTGGRLQVLLGNHISNIAKEEQEHATVLSDIESQIATLRATQAREERIFALKTAANEALRAELQAKVDTYNGPQHRLTQLQSEEATAKMQELTTAVFSQEWLEANGLQAVATPETLKVIIAQAMQLAQKAQHLGIRITPQRAEDTQPGPFQQSAPAITQIPAAPQFEAGAFS